MTKKELKTLKDFEIERSVLGLRYSEPGNIHTDTIVYPSDLRKEAIKWIKEEVTIKANEHLPAPEDKVHKIVHDELLSSEIQRWMKRFDLRIEDLK